MKSHLLKQKQKLRLKDSCLPVARSIDIEKEGQQSLTCLSPDWQVFILLDVQHELQAVSHASLGGDERRLSITAGVEGVTLPVASENLRDSQEEKVKLLSCSESYLCFSTGGQC